MSKKIELIHTEVITQYQSDEVLREFATEKGGTVFTWSVKTKVNDQAEKSPFVFDTCSSFADNDEQKAFIRSTVMAGAILDITGYQDRRKGKKAGPDGKFPYYDQINVKNIVSITNDSGSEGESQASNDGDDNLPF